MIVSLQALGQIALGFKVSIAQILVTILACMVVEMVITYRRQGALVWPASAILTANGVAFILRAAGTRHGDWWTLHGIHWFLLAAIVGLLSKYALTIDGRHYYNPSNFGLVTCLLLVGAPAVYPQYLWWGPVDLPVLAVLVIIVGGVIWVIKPIRMLPMAAASLASFWLLIGLLAANGDCFLAVWHEGPVCGTAFWVNLCFSPEVLIFVFYMMSDPKSSPTSQRGRLIYAMLTAALAAALIVPQTTEFGVKVALLGALSVVCSAPALGRLRRNRPRVEKLPRPRLGLRGTIAVMALIAVTVSVAVAALGDDPSLVEIELGPGQ